VEEAACLLSVQRRIRGVKIQDQSIGWAFMGVDKPLQQKLVNGYSCLPI
jgi:hypothetical protein